MLEIQSIFYVFLTLLLLITNAYNTDDSWNKENLEFYDDDLLLTPNLRHKEKSKNDHKICKTKACKLLEASILSKMNIKYHPCTDMYKFSCGNFIDMENKRIPQRDASTFGELIHVQTVKMIKIVEGLKGRKENDVYKKVYDWYAACKNTKEKKKLGSSPLKKVLKKAQVSWPLLDEFWDEEDWDLEKAVAFTHRDLSIFPLFTVTVDNDARNVSGSPYGLALGSPPIVLTAAEFYLKKSTYADNIIYAYFKLLYKLSTLFGAQSSIFDEALGCFINNNCDIDKIERDILNVILFEMNIAKVISKIKTSYLISPTTTLGELQKAYGERTFNWKRYISLLYKDIPDQPPFRDDEVIYISQPELFKDIMLLIENTEPRIVANYILTRILFEYGGILSPEFRQPYLDFYGVAYGIKTFTKANVRCIHSVSKDLMLPVTALFVKDNLPEKDLSMAEDLVKRLTESYDDHLKYKVDWMDDVTRRAALKKVNNMMAHVGYPRAIRNTTILNKIYKKVKVDPLKYFKNVLRLNQLRTKIDLSRRGTLHIRSSWDMKMTSANAQYSPASNKITVGAGLLQPPLFHRDYPRARTYGSIGMAIGHEMTHGFDPLGARYDDKGNVHLWWTNKTYQTFNEKKKCMIKQYKKFTVYNEHINGIHTLGENVADNGGLRIAYEAYCRSLKFDGKDKSLPRVRLTSKQLFFLSYGQLWCKHKTRSSAINSLHTDEHSPARARVNLVLQNMEEFSETFNCPKGSPMNPKKKCIVW